MNQFKRVKVVMLPTNIKSLLWINYSKLYLHNFERLEQNNQHLYIISDDEIREGDKIIHKRNIYTVSINRGLYTTVKELLDIDLRTDNCKKIIATTDGSLKLYETITDYKVIAGSCKILPQPSLQFIEKYIESYNKGEIITDILVEYEEYNHHHINYNTDGRSIKNASSTWRTRLKVNPKDNTITIRKTKDNWNREELPIDSIITLRNSLNTPIYKRKFGEDSVIFEAIKELNEWIKENL